MLFSVYTSRVTTIIYCRRFCGVRTPLINKNNIRGPNANKHKRRIKFRILSSHSVTNDNIFGGIRYFSSAMRMYCAVHLISSLHPSQVFRLWEMLEKRACSLVLKF